MTCRYNRQLTTKVFLKMFLTVNIISPKKKKIGNQNIPLNYIHKHMVAYDSGKQCTT